MTVYLVCLVSYQAHWPYVMYKTLLRMMLIGLVVIIFVLYFSIPPHDQRWSSDVSYAGQLTPEMIKQIWEKDVEKSPKGLSGHEVRWLGWLIDAEYSWYGLKPTIVKQIIPGGKTTLDFIMVGIIILLLMPLCLKTGLSNSLVRST